MFHTLETIDAQKVPKLTKDLVIKEASKGYAPKYISANFSSVVTSVVSPSRIPLLPTYLPKDLASNTRKLAGMQRSTESHLLTAVDFENANALINTDEELVGSTVEYYCRETRVSTKSFVFSSKKQLKILQDFGYLVLLDSTHKTNSYIYSYT